MASRFFIALKRILPFFSYKFDTSLIRLPIKSDMSLKVLWNRFWAYFAQNCCTCVAPRWHLRLSPVRRRPSAPFLFWFHNAHRFQYWLYSQNAMYCIFGWVCLNKCGLHTWKFYKIHTDTLQKPCYTVWKIESSAALAIVLSSRLPAWAMSALTVQKWPPPQRATALWDGGHYFWCVQIRADHCAVHRVSVRPAPLS